MTTEKELEKIHIKEAIKANTVIHCETEEEAERILEMAHELGYKWWTGKNYENNTEWNIYKNTMCYYLFDGSYSTYDYFKNKNYTIIPSTQIGSPPGAVLRLPITAGGMKRSGLRAINCQPPPKIERETKPTICTEPALFYTACYRFGLY